MMWDALGRLRLPACLRLTRRMAVRHRHARSRVARRRGSTRIWPQGPPSRPCVERRAQCGDASAVRRPPGAVQRRAAQPGPGLRPGAPNEARGAARCLGHARRVCRDGTRPLREPSGLRRGCRAHSTAAHVRNRRDQLATVVADSRTSTGVPSTHLPTRTDIVARHGLTPREADVALLLARGRSRAQVAAALGLSPHTVRHHTEIVFRKLNVHARAAVAMALLGESQLATCAAAPALLRHPPGHLRPQ